MNETRNQTQKEKPELVISAQKKKNICFLLFRSIEKLLFFFPKQKMINFWWLTQKKQKERKKERSAGKVITFNVICRYFYWMKISLFLIFILRQKQWMENINVYTDLVVNLFVLVYFCCLLHIVFCLPCITTVI